MVTQDDSYQMTREDILRELELLPVWQLRAPFPAMLFAESLPSVSVVDAQNTLEKGESSENSLIENAVTNTAFLVSSDDKKWVFVLPAVLVGQSDELFTNILRALKIKPTQMAHSLQLIQDIEQLGAKIVIAMGEIAAQQLLTSAETIENLRGKLHLVNGIQVVVTYHPDELLQHLPNKAKTWDDLCIALSAVSA
ncbi:MAG: uracil-DNA glycosylase family protein [Pseudomonadota bacterium]